MKNKLIVLFIIALSFVSCQGKQREEVAKESHDTPSINHKVYDSNNTDSVKEALKKEYKLRREDTNSNWPYGDRGMRDFMQYIKLDDLIFQGKEEFYRKIKQDIENAIVWQKEYEDESAKEEHREVRYSYAYSGYDYFDVFQYTFPITVEYLKKNNFTFPSTDIFKKRMKEVFGYDGQVKNSFPKVKEDNQLYCFSINAGQPNYPEQYSESDMLEEHGERSLFRFYFYSYTGYNFIYTSFPDWGGTPANMYKVEEMRDTKNWMVPMRENIYHQNNYIFNNSDISLKWLYQHDQEFLTMLYERFGYYGDDKLTQLYVNDIKEAFERELTYDIKVNFEYTPIGVNTDSPTLLANLDLFFGTYRSYDNKFLINKRLLEQLVKQTNSKTDYIYPFMIQKFVIKLDQVNYDNCFSDQNKISEFKMFLLAHLSYYSQKMYEKNLNMETYSPILMSQSVLYNELMIEKSRNKLLSYLKKNNYFGYSDYLSMIEKIRKESSVW